MESGASSLSAEIENEILTTGLHPMLLFFILTLSHEAKPRTIGHITIRVNTTLNLLCFDAAVYRELVENGHLNHDQRDKAEFNIKDFHYRDAPLKIHYHDEDVADRVVKTDEELTDAVVLLEQRGWSPHDNFELHFDDSHMRKGFWKRFIGIFKREKKEKLD